MVFSNMIYHTKTKSMMFSVCGMVLECWVRKGEGNFAHCASASVFGARFKKCGSIINEERHTRNGCGA